MEDSEVLQLYGLRYSDLLLVSSNDASPSSELERLESTGKAIMEALGPTGPGLLAITGVPNASALRCDLLPLARKLALLNPNHRKTVLKDQKLGSDVPLKNPERNVSSFAMQIKYSDDFDETQLNSEHGSTTEFENIGNGFKKLGFLMMELGLQLARVCDRAIGGNELEQSLLESCTAKARLIHYHSPMENAILVEEAMSTNGRSKSKKTLNSNKNRVRDDSDEQKLAGICSSNLWQQWHYDYGIFTVLTAPMFLLPYDQECGYPNGHTYLQVFDPSKNNVFMVKASPESFIIQVGEAADIISRGKLRATLHSVGKPSKFENLSRETFVLFLQPAWNKTFSISDYPMNQCPGRSEEIKQVDEPERSRVSEEIGRIVPPLALRFKDGMTFADFSRETTKQYYGGTGLQSNR